MLLTNFVNLFPERRLPAAATGTGNRLFCDKVHLSFRQEGYYREPALRVCQAHRLSLVRAFWQECPDVKKVDLSEGKVYYMASSFSRT